MVTANVRRVGNRLVVTLPEDAAARLGVGEGDLVSREGRRLGGRCCPRTWRPRSAGCWRGRGCAPRSWTSPTADVATAGSPRPGSRAQDRSSGRAGVPLPATR
jgi:hypothetical protein